MSIFAPEHLEGTSFERWWVDLESVRQDVDKKADRFGLDGLDLAVDRIAEAMQIIEGVGRHARRE